ncbi:MAG: ribonuclease III [Flavobacteriales bacterium]|nr:ribonuclease III [Flavobacteriales bacterium]
MGLFDFLFPKKYAKQKLPIEFQQLVGFQKGELHWYDLAFTHKSVLNRAEQNIPGKSNERLEFLGDSILDSVVGDFLFNTFPNKEEGFLSQMRSKFVSRKHLSSIALELKLATFLKTNLGKNDKAESIYGNALEALIGAIYLDKGYKEVALFIHRIMLSERQVAELLASNSDYKSKLLEWCQQEKKELRFITEPDANLLFTCQLKMEGKLVATGAAKTKKQAEQVASKQAFELIKVQGKN